ncbi:MAG: nucleotidyltransferase family protein [Armatimonadetes bacterium]|nr:nucleotidyltransferase family protein [Armatimonadota bacterium]
MVVAGGRIGGVLAQETGAWTKGMIQVGGTTCLESAVRALRACPRIDKVAVVCDPGLRARVEHLEVDVWVHERPRGFENFYVAFHYLPRDRPALLCVSDMPFAHLGKLERLLEACDTDAAVHYALTREEDFRRYFPGSSRRFVPMREGRFTAAGIAVVDPVRFPATEDTFRRLFQSRKNTLPMALKLGAGFLLRRVLGTLTIAEVEGRLSDIVEVTLRAVPCGDAHFTFDVDTVADYRYALGWLNERSNPEAASVATEDPSS